MVYCAKCGTQNDDDAAHCTKCGEPLGSTQRNSRNWEEEIEVRAEEFGERAERFGRRMEGRHMVLSARWFSGFALLTTLLFVALLAKAAPKSDRDSAEKPRTSQ